MSETRLYTVNALGDVEVYERYQNAHGGAMAIWRTLSEEYFPQESLGGMLMDSFKPLFDLLKKDALKPWEATTLITTCDRILIPIEQVSLVAAALEEFSKAYGSRHEGCSFSIPDQAVSLRKIAEEAQEKGWRGVCWNQMSVCETIWEGVYEEKEDEDAIRPYNIDSDSSHWVWTAEYSS